MATLTRASQELFSRRPDECFQDFDALYEHCKVQKESGVDRWHAPPVVRPSTNEGRLDFKLGGDGLFRLNDWSFGQLCRLAGVSRDTVNKISPATAAKVFEETLPQSTKPLQAFTYRETIRSIHGAAYTRLHDVDLLSVVREFATDFQPPQKSKYGGGTGLYAGEQDLFVFLIDPLGWAEIEGQAFAPGFFLWNSEVGRRSIGIQAFWFQAVCANHIVWDATEVVDFSRKHTANVHDSLREIRRIITELVAKRDARRDGFARVMGKAFKEVLGEKAEDVAKLLVKHGIPRDLGQKALKLAEEQGRFTVYSVVDALTRIARDYQNAGDRNELDQKAGTLLALAAR